MENTLKTTQTTENINTLEQKYALLEQEVEVLNAKLKWYEEQFRLSQAQRFTPSSEKTPDGQVSLFDEAEKESDPKTLEPTVEEITYKRRKQQGKRDQMLEDLPVETIHYHLSEEEMSCPTCDGSLHEMSKEVRKELKIVPAQVKVVEHVRHVYACRNCEANHDNSPVITAPMPAPAFTGSLASSSLVAYIMNRKYVEAMPLYRQEQQLKHFGIDLSRQTLSNWMIRGSEEWLSFVYHRMHEYLVKLEILHADETELQVLKEEGRTAANKSYMWHYSSGHTDVPIQLYEYQTTRASKHPQRFLENFTGYLHTDGYAGYNNLTGINIVACFAHARRKFTDTLKALPKEVDRSTTTASEGLAFCDRLFDVERKLSDKTPEERYILRLEQSQPILEEFHSWLKTQKKQVLPKTSLGQAITYCLNQWDKLKRILLDGRLEISNNRAERGIKPFVLGRKNWMFSNTAKGAKSSAIIYSVVETAKANGLSPFHYLKYLFEKLPTIDLSDQEQLDQLLPWSDTLPEECRSPLKKK